MMATQKIFRASLRRDDYYAFRKLSPDASDLPSSFDQWFDQSTKEEASLRAKGVTVERILIEPQEFAAWVQRTGFAPNGIGREAFALEKARERAG